MTEVEQTNLRTFCRSSREGALRSVTYGANLSIRLGGAGATLWASAFELPAREIAVPTACARMSNDQFQTFMYQHQPITQWALEDRPREKMLQRGIDALTDAELLAIILGSGTRELSAIGLARQVLKQVGSLAQLARCGVPELVAIKGIGPAKAIAIVSAFELGRRKGLAPHEVIKFTSSDKVANYLIPRLADLNQEVFYVMFLNRNNEIKAEKPFFRGGVAATVIDAKLIFREAINQLACGVILAHNHPSGNLTPSQADLQITRKLREGGKLFDIAVLDHIIVSHRGYFSFADEGLMD